MNQNEYIDLLKAANDLYVQLLRLKPKVETSPPAFPPVKKSSVMVYVLIRERVWDIASQAKDWRLLLVSSSLNEAMELGHEDAEINSDLSQWKKQDDGSWLLSKHIRGHDYNWIIKYWTVRLEPEGK